MSVEPIPKYAPMPDGYVLVAEGDIQEGDLVWDDSDREWEIVGKEEIGDEASAYFGIARKIEEKSNAII